MQTVDFNDLLTVINSFSYFSTVMEGQNFGKPNMAKWLIVGG